MLCFAQAQVEYEGMRDAGLALKEELSIKAYKHRSVSKFIELVNNITYRTI